MNILHPRRPRSSSWSSSRICRPSALDKLGIPRATFYRWYDLHQGGRAWRRWLIIALLAGSRLESHSDDVRGQIIDLALQIPELSPRELVVRFTDERKYLPLPRHQSIGC